MLAVLAQHWTARLEPDHPLPPDLVWGQGPSFNNRLVQEIQGPLPLLLANVTTNAQVFNTYLPNLDVLMIERLDRFGRGGDHTPFNQLGFTAVRFTEFHENFIHQHQTIRKEKGIQYGDLPDPSPAAGEVLVDIHAASINAADWKMRAGQPVLLLDNEFETPTVSTGNGTARPAPSLA